nr:hypothetical protein [Tanacetum cinerariifolium]GEV89634.1 hypothetical protein [Tanacetum cinerariifolium]GEW06050.1 hypothetical protein [Tanacetum cinerariifolium]
MDYNDLHSTCINNTTIEFSRNAYFNPIQQNIEFNYDYEDMELHEESGYTTDEESVMSEHEAIDPAHAVNTQFFKKELSSEEDLDEWLKVEMEKHMSKKNEKNEEDALISIIKSIREECRVVHKNKQISASGADLKNLLRPLKTPLIVTALQVFYGDESGEDYGMWPTYDPNSSFCYGYKEVFKKSEQGMLRHWVCFHDHKRRIVKGSCMGFADFLQVRYRNQRIDDTTHERRYYEWFAQNYEFDNNKTPPTTTVFDKYPYKTNHLTPIPLDEWDTKCHVTYTGSTSNENIPNNDPTPFSLEPSELGEKANISESLKLRPFRPRPCDYSFDEWLKVKIGLPT